MPIVTKKTRRSVQMPVKEEGAVEYLQEKLKELQVQFEDIQHEIYTIEDRLRDIENGDTFTQLLGGQPLRKFHLENTGLSLFPRIKEAGTNLSTVLTAEEQEQLRVLWERYSHSSLMGKDVQVIVMALEAPHTLIFEAYES